MATGTKRKTAYQILQAAKARYCKGKTTAAVVKKAATNYIAKAVKAGKTKAEAEKSANRVVKGGCSMSSSIAGKKRKPIKRKSKK